jgi:hypothetical protein
LDDIIQKEGMKGRQFGGEKVRRGAKLSIELEFIPHGLAKEKCFDACGQIPWASNWQVMAKRHNSGK